ncbi:MAG: hypothetical protein QNJ46_31875 [Leptolyngbyaceae cyanobacterium MO_188.B28]|nr:hypothetical protein [Leptolyngbyaceae cyanobacterium MO_188.B28]
MAGFGNIVQKAFYLGVGIASYAGEKAGSTLSELRDQAQKLVDELVARGEITAEEAQKMVNDMVERAQKSPAEGAERSGPTEPRQIEILDDEQPTSPEAQEAEEMRRQVETLREELEKLKQKKQSN